MASPGDPQLKPAGDAGKATGWFARVWQSRIVPLWETRLDPPIQSLTSSGLQYASGQAAQQQAAAEEINSKVVKTYNDVELDRMRLLSESRSRQVADGCTAITTALTAMEKLRAMGIEPSQELVDHVELAAIEVLGTASNGRLKAPDTANDAVPNLPVKRSPGRTKAIAGKQSPGKTKAIAGKTSRTSKPSNKTESSG